MEGTCRAGSDDSKEMMSRLIKGRVSNIGGALTYMYVHDTVNTRYCDIDINDFWPIAIWIVIQLEIGKR